MGSETVGAVVVTYNRKDLLRECLGALLAQTRPLARIFVVDNVSTDGTREMLAHEFAPEQFPQITLLALPQNVGGAGGFHAGMKRAAEERLDWLWVMDDDSIPQPDALAELFAARARFPETQRPDLLASNVIWTDGSVHPMNVPSLKRKDVEALYRAARYGTLSLRYTSFVSMLVHRGLVERYGLPIADYFIGNDDVEYTGRILRHEFGVLVPASLVVHKSPKNSPAGPRFYYGVRNQLWMVIHSAAWTGEKAWRLGVLARAIGQYLREGPLSWSKVRAVGAGLFDGLFKAPKRSAE